MISASDVKSLRERTGCGMMDCKAALTEANGNLDRAIEILRESGLAKAAKKAGRIASEGLIVSYIHGGGRIGVLVEVNSETDFVAKNEEFQEFTKDVAMHIAAASPAYVTREEVPADVVEKEAEILKAQAINEGKPEAIAEKMVAGRIEKFYKEICLLEQPFVKNPDISVGELLTEKIAKIGENLSIRRFARFERGEGLEKKESDFASEIQEILG